MLVKKISGSMIAACSMFTLLLAVTQIITGKSAMAQSSNPSPLLWQGAADRKPVQFLPIEVTKIERDKGGLFGIMKSPSIVGSFPNAVNIEGRQLENTREAITVRAPGAELPSALGAGTHVVLGLVDAQHVICFLIAPEGMPISELKTWAARQSCTQN